MANYMKRAFTNEKWSKVADEYERNAEHFITHWTNDALRIADQRMLDAVAKSASTASSKPTFVDVGCGTGALCLAFAEKYLSPPTQFTATQDATANPMKDVQIIATDLADGMLSRVDEKLDMRPRYQQFRSQIKTMQMDGQLLDKLDDESVDIVGSSFGLSIFPDRVKAWGSAARVLKDGGVLFATVWDSQSPNLRWADACAKLAYEAQLAADGASADNDEPPQLFVPSTKVGHDNIASELRAAGFHNIEMYRSQHSVVCETPSVFVNGMVDNPGFSGFIEHAGRERIEDLFYEAIAQEGGFATAHPLTREEVRKSTRPVTIDFIGHVLVATK